MKKNKINKNKLFVEIDCRRNLIDRNKIIACLRHAACFACVRFPAQTRRCCATAICNCTWRLNARYFRMCCFCLFYHDWNIEFDIHFRNWRKMSRTNIVIANIVVAGICNDWSVIKNAFIQRAHIVGKHWLIIILWHIANLLQKQFEKNQRFDSKSTEKCHAIIFFFIFIWQMFKT